MACWIVSLDGGPKKPNQAAIVINDKIYSFGSCCCYERGFIEPELAFGVHVLNPADYRWQFVQTRRFEPNPSEQFIDGTGEIYQPYGEIPTLRSGHSVVAYKGKAYMWGGYCYGREILSTSLYCFDPEERTWSVIPHVGPTPAPREKHTAVVFNDMMIIYGGLINNQLRFCENVWGYNFRTRKWYSTLITGDIPRGRIHHTACVIEKKMYVFGGVDQSNHALYLNVLDLRRGHWETTNVTGHRPYAVRDACCWVHNNKMYIFAGCRHRDGQYVPSLYRFDPEISMWSKIRPFGFRGASGRQHHCGVVVGDCAYVFTGLTQSIVFTEMFGYGYVMEMCDLHVLSFNWTLKDLSAIAVLQHGLYRIDSDELPLELKVHLAMMTESNDLL
ncbi:hypothetical protein LOAG_05947 [Loa loa]|uniref:Kelch domain-containing protein 10 n=1 Tax=Loa loa TaxID=7209 RepID=A0A1I7W4J3_LOALO|nr:hypothetical protein LOAG_05947 [Loa loa]EFO22539.1 hypothetical protein LOAG_05947 [Loa loa]